MTDPGSRCPKFTAREPKAPITCPIAAHYGCMTARARQPGDVIIDRYMPGVTEAEREEARADLYEFFGTLLAIKAELGDEQFTKLIRARKAQEVELERPHPQV